MKKIIIFSASNGKNLELAEKIYSVLDTDDSIVEVIELGALELPLYTNQNAKSGPDEKVVKIVEALKQVESMVFIAPEYNGGLPPAFTNFLAWVSISTKNWRESFNGKTAVIGTHSGSGGLHALMAMRIQLSYIGMNVLGRQIHTHYKKEVKEETLEVIREALLKLEND